MCDATHIVNMRVEVLKSKSVRLHGAGLPHLVVHGEAELKGVKVPHDEDEWWVVFPAQGNRGLTMEELLNATWDKKVIAWDIHPAGPDTETFG